MPDGNKKIQVEFAPGCFDSFDGTQEELDALVAEIQRMAQSGELEAQSIPLDSDEILDELDEEDRAHVMESLHAMSDQTRKIQ